MDLHYFRKSKLTDNISIVYGDFVFRLTTGVVPSQAIGVTIPPQTPAIMRSIHSNAGLSKKAIIAQVMQDMPAEIYFTESEIDELYHLSVECNTNFLSQEQLITKISNLRGGAPIPGADGFTGSPNNPRCRQNPNQCRNYDIFSRSAGVRHNNNINNVNDSHFEPSLNTTFEKKQLQRKFRHAKQFGVEGNYNPANRDLFQRKLIEHMKSTHACLGTYKGREYNRETHLNVHRRHL